MEQKYAEPVTGGPRGTGPLETAVLFSILSHERRRYALYCLQQCRNPMTLDELVRL